MWCRGSAVIALGLVAGCDVVFRLDDLAATDDSGVPVDSQDDANVVDGRTIDPRITAQFDFEGNLVDTVSGGVGVCVGPGCADFGSGKHGMAITLNGSECVQFLLTNPARFTVAMWINKYTDIGQSVVAKPVGTLGSNSFQVDTETNRTVRFITWNGLSNAFTTEAAAFELNQWQHIAVTFDGDAKRLFVNGVMSPSVATSEQVVFDAAPLLIGCDRDSGNHVRFFAGRIDEVIVYNAALTAGEIAALAL